LQKFNPGVKATACLFSAESGIIDSHKLMESFIEITKSFSGEIAYLHQLIGIEKSQDTYRCKLQCGSDKFFISTKYLINCGGLNSDKIAKMAGIDVIKEKLDLSYCKGRYYRLHSSKKSIATNLIYPIPPENYSGLGIHLTIDLAGELKLGPDTVYMEENIQNYEVEDVKDKFFAAAKTYLNGISIDDLSPDQSGIRAKLQKQGESIRDFYIANESKYGFDNFINLIGIESPGLTSSLAIAKYISENLVE